MPYNRYNVIGVSATSLTKEIFGESEDAWSDEEDFAMEDEEVQDDYGSEEEDQIDPDGNEGLQFRPRKLIPVINPNECGVCLDDLNDSSDVYTVEECNHRFCKGCIADYITFKTKDAYALYHTITRISLEKNFILKIEVFKSYGVSCPAMGCHHVMLINELQQVSTSSALDQFHRFSKVHEENLLRIAELRALGKPKNLFECPGCGKETEVTKVRHRGRARCTHCHCPFCAKCGVIHPTFANCTGWTKSQRRMMGEFNRLTLKFIEKMGYKKCPRCHYYAEKVSGCNFMYCRCGTNFCNLCGCLLDQSLHHSHFLQGPYGNSCKGKSDAAKLSRFNK